MTKCLLWATCCVVAGILSFSLVTTSKAQASCVLPEGDAITNRVCAETGIRWCRARCNGSTVESETAPLCGSTPPSAWLIEDVLDPSYLYHNNCPCTMYVITDEHYLDCSETPSLIWDCEQVILTAKEKYATCDYSASYDCPFGHKPRQTVIHS